MKLDSLARNWNALGEADPLWAILWDPERRGNRWDLDDFLATGEAEIDRVVKDLSALGLAPIGRGLDFGCGVGRLTQALAGRLAEVDGVDIAPSMIDKAREINRHPDRVRYHVNPASDLRQFPDASFDLVLTIIVLQHIESRYVIDYLAEFLRVLRPGGVLYFTLPSHPAPTLHGLVARLPNPVLNLYRRVRHSPGGVMELHGIHRSRVEEIVSAHGGVVTDVSPDRELEPLWTSYRYVVVKPA